MNGELRLLLNAIDQAYDRRSWHGTSLRGSIRGVRADVAARRPAPGRHSIWELTLHAAYWKYAVTRRLTGAKRGSFPIKGSNWFAVPEDPSARAWRGVVALVDDRHHALREAVAAMPPRALSRPAAGTGFTYTDLILGIAAHDLYHAGQIQLVKRFVKP